MQHRLEDIARALGLTCAGDGEILITHLAEPEGAGSDALALATNRSYAEALSGGSARAAVLWEDADWQALGLDGALLPARPRHALSGLSAMMDPGQGYAPGVHETAVIDPSAHLGREVSVGPFCVIDSDVRIGEGSVIASHCTIGSGTEIGPRALLHAGVRLMARVAIGADFIAQPNAVVGGDGFSFVTPQTSGVERARETLGTEGAQEAAEGQSWARIHSLGGVEIGDNVELGAGTTIDRGTIRATRIGTGTKIDNLVQIGHNVIIGEDCLICAQAGIAGSTRIGRGSVLGGQTGVADNLTIGENVICGGGTIVLSNVPAGRVMLGYPAMKMESHVASYKALRRLPRLMTELARLRKPVPKDGESA